MVGPDFFTCPSAEVDFKEGGRSLVCMRAPREFGRQDLYNTWSYHKIVPLERIEYSLNLTDQEGVKIDPVTIGVRPDFPQEVQTVITFKAVGKDRTDMTVTEFGFPEGQMYDFAEMGLNQSLDKMAGTFARS